MIDTFQDLADEFMTAAWENARSSISTQDAPALINVLGVLEQVTARAAGLRLDVIDQAQYLPNGPQVVDAVESSTAETSGRLRAQIRLATTLAERLPLIGAALQEGLISMPQAQAIADGFKHLPATFGQQDLQQCQTQILKHTDDLGPTELRTLATRLVELVDPESADEKEAAALEAEQRRAHQTRRLRLMPDHHGSVTIAGRLPVADGALLKAQLEALMPPLTSYEDTGQKPERDARMADALVLLTQVAGNSGELPQHGADRPHIVITMDHNTLVTGLGEIGLTGDQGSISPGEARRLACDASLVPVVLGGDSRPLDVGREHRLFTKTIRTALILRDGGCVFPGCAATPAACEAHHIIPWWQGGNTGLDNAVLLCPHHHRLVEPDPNQSKQSQWEVHLGPATGLPWFTPPGYVDPDRRPRQHQRHRLNQIINTAESEPANAGNTDPPESRPRHTPTLEDLYNNEWNRAQT